jgi:hypothetical protein
MKISTLCAAALLALISIGSTPGAAQSGALDKKPVAAKPTQPKKSAAGALPKPKAKPKPKTATSNKPEASNLGSAARQAMFKDTKSGTGAPKKPGQLPKSKTATPAAKPPVKPAAKKTPPKPATPRAPKE